MPIQLISTEFPRETREETRGCCGETRKGNETGCARKHGYSLNGRRISVKHPPGVGRWPAPRSHSYQVRARSRCEPRRKWRRRRGCSGEYSLTLCTVGAIALRADSGGVGHSTPSCRSCTQVTPGTPKSSTCALALLVARLHHPLNLIMLRFDGERHHAPRPLRSCLLYTSPSPRD